MSRILCIIAIPLWMATMITAAIVVGALIPFERVLFPAQFSEKDHAPQHCGRFIAADVTVI